MQPESLGSAGGDSVIDRSVTVADAEVLTPGSADEAIVAFGDGSGVTVVGGGTIVVPEIAAARLKPAKALFLGKAGLSGVTRTGAR
jgi:hypothetical protein